MTTKEDSFTDFEITPLVKSLRGSFKASLDFDYKTELNKELFNKYLHHTSKECKKLTRKNQKNYSFANTL